MTEGYFITKEQFRRLDILLSNCYGFAEGVGSENITKQIAEFDVEVFDAIRVNQQRTEDD